MGFVITGCANLMILGEIPSYPVAFLMFNLFNLISFQQPTTVLNQTICYQNLFHHKL